jgi:hypothetical protein
MLNKHQNKYSTVEKGCLALILAINILKSTYLQSSRDPLLCSVTKIPSGFCINSKIRIRVVNVEFDVTRDTFIKIFVYYSVVI